jgi:DNA helicase-2/ATP-dependent DNA helicase PcrA
MLNEEQKLPAHYDGSAKNLLILAGAGTGKTTTLVERIRFLITKKKIKPSRILAVTFTNRSARDMKARLRKTLGSKVDDLQMKTFHAYVLSVLIEFPQFFSEKRHTIIDGQDQKSLMKVVVANYAAAKGLPVERMPPSDFMIESWSFCKNTCISLSTHLENLALDVQLRPYVEDIIQEYEAHKKQRGYLDFDDLLIKFCAEIKRNPVFKETMNGLFDHILVDEYQDANPIQYFFLKLMTMRETNLFAVGDPKQSIYAFRGASFDLIHSFTEKFPNSVVFNLVINYRTHQENLDLANWFLDKSTLDYGNKLVSGKTGAGNKPVVKDFYSPFSEAQWIASSIKQLLSSDVDPGEIMVLFRSSFDGMPLKKALIEQEIKFQVIGGDNIYKTAHIKDLISVIRITTNHDDEIAWMRFLTLWKGVGAAKANKTIPQIMACRGNKQAIIQTLHDVFGSGHSVTQIYQQLLTLKNKPAEAIGVIAGYMPEILQIKKYDKNRERISDVQALCDYASGFSTLDSLLDDIALEPATFSQLANKHKRNTVTLITIHSAKGTEADYCFMPAVKDGNYPNKKSKGDLNDEEEERRVAYVALTRVKHQLFITRVNDVNQFPDQKTLPAKTEEFFFQKIPKDLLEI